MISLLAEAWRQALRNVGAHRRRSFLTLLTIAIGIFSITAVRVFTYSMERTIVGRFERLGASTVYVHHFTWRFSGSDWQKEWRRPRLSLTDYEVVQKGLEGEAWVALRYDQFNQPVRFKSRTEQVRILGVTEQFAQVFPVELRAGRYFRPEELRGAGLVAIVGSELARQLTGSDNPIGLVIWYKGRPLQVIGVLKVQGSFAGELDKAMLVPFPLLYRLYGLPRYAGDRTLLVRAKDPEALPIDLLEVRVRGLMRQARRLPPQAEENFSINRQDALLDEVRRFTGYVQLVGFFIAAFSLLVGGLGVANMLYIAVRERRGEIGIQRAMGAPRPFILGLFLVEGLLLALTGGGIGLVLTALLVAGLSGWAAQQGLVLAVAPVDLLWTVALIVTVGLVAALAPAWQAARLHPIEAIRTAL